MESCTTCAYPLKEDFTHTDLALTGRLAINLKMRYLNTTGNSFNFLGLIIPLQLYPVSQSMKHFKQYVNTGRDILHPVQLLRNNGLLNHLSQSYDPSGVFL